MRIKEESAMDFKELRRYVGSEFQHFGVKEFMLLRGKENGVRMMQVKNGGKLRFDVVTDRAVDIGNLEHKGLNCSFMSKTGIVNSKYYVENGPDGFYKNFYGGMLTSCGMTHMGAPCEDEGRKLGLHGPLSCTPAEEVSVRTEKTDTNAPYIEIKGKMRQSEVYAENLVMDRTIRVDYGKDIISIRDTVTNKAFVPAPFMLLYHYNFGYPFLSEKTKLMLSYKEFTPRDEPAAKGQNRKYVFEKPEDGRPEECYFYKLASDGNGITKVLVENEELEIAAVLQFNTGQLEYMTEWKSMMAGDYALGINPGTYTPMGRAHARQNGLLKFIQPGESLHFDVSIEFTDDKNYIKKLQNIIKCLTF